MALGRGVFVAQGCWLQVLGDEHGPTALVIGDDTIVMAGAMISAAASVRIGDTVGIGRNAYISDHSHVHDDRSRAVLEQGITSPAPVEIGDGAWLGQNVVIGPGVRIGRGSVIGANAVVLEDVPDHAVAVGVPARVVHRPKS